MKWGKYLFAIVAFFVLGGTATAESPAHRHFFSALSGSEEVPPVDTDAAGQAVFQLTKDGTELRFRLVVGNIEGVTEAHICLAPEGLNGPMVVVLFGVVPRGPTINAIVAEGILTQDDLVGELTGQPLGVLITNIVAGNAYVNVHTGAFPYGEIRGQIKPGGS